MPRSVNTASSSSGPATCAASSSATGVAVDFDDLHQEREYTDVTAYCRSKLALISRSREAESR
jgi:hypothetical protein